MKNNIEKNKKSNGEEIAEAAGKLTEYTIKSVFQFFKGAGEIIKRKSEEK